MSPLIAYYGDDFTGASDTLATAAQAGLRTILFLRVPSSRELAKAGPLDCLGIAGTARSLGPTEMERELRPVAAFFKSLAPQIIHYKTCSTFDSAPSIGSIGHAATILRPLVPNPFTPIVGGQPNLRRYCLFANLFAAAGIGGDVHRLDRHPTMSAHPVTPMAESDLRRHLARQGLKTILSLPYTAYDQPDTLDDQVAALLVQSPDAILLDVARAEDLPVIGRLMWRRAANGAMLAIGPSSVVDALARGRDMPATAAAPARIAPAAGPVFVLSGSLSPVTRGQLQAAPSFTAVEIDAAKLMTRGADTLETVTSLLAQGRHVIAHTTSLTGDTATSIPARDVAQACGSFVLQLVKSTRLRRIGIAGGDTSSYAIKALDIWGLSHLGALGAGVALCRAHAGDPNLDGVELMLKGGQMGTPDIFERLIHGT